MNRRETDIAWGWIVLLLSGLLLANGCATAPAPAPGREVLYQVSTLQALLDGVYDGAATCGQLRRNGDLGIGTFEGLDGELILLDGRVWQAAADGRIRAMPDSAPIPFACATFFDSDRSAVLRALPDAVSLRQQLDALRAGPNRFCAVRVDGRFAKVKVRSVPKQAKPYPPLAEVTKTQPVFEFENVEGTLVGFWFPAWCAGVNLPGWHLHFLAKDGRGGGHLLECALTEGVAQADDTLELRLELPGGESFRDARLEGRAAEAHAAEQTPTAK